MTHSNTSQVNRIERNGTGIERNGTGIRRFGNVFAIALAAACTTLTAGAPEAARAGMIGAAAADVPATVVVRGKHVSLQIGDAQCSLSGTGVLQQGYARFPLAYTVYDGAIQGKVHGSGSGAPDPDEGKGRVHGLGSGAPEPDEGRVHGSGSGAPGSGSNDGTNATSRTCAELFRQFPIERGANESATGASFQLWGEAEIAVDGPNPAAVLIHMFDQNGQPRSAQPLEAQVLIQ
jgi:hypothetical protein